MALSKGDGEQQARLSPVPLPTSAGKAGSLAQSSTQGWGGGRHMDAAGAAPAAPTHPAGGARKDKDRPVMCFLVWLFFFIFILFFPLLPEPPHLWKEPTNWIHSRPSLKIISIRDGLCLGSSASSQRQRGWQGPPGQGIAVGLGQSWAPWAESVELDLILGAECLRVGGVAVLGEMGMWVLSKG